MTYLSDLHAYLHQSSLLIQAYPSTRISTKYSLPRRPHGRPDSKRSQKAARATAPATSDVNTQSSTIVTPSKEQREKREPAATLTLKTFHPESGICLKYRTDKAQEVGRLLNGLGRLARGEIIEVPSTSTMGVVGAPEDKMDVDGGDASVAVLKDGKSDLIGVKSAAEMTQGQPQQQQSQPQGSGGGKKKKKGGKK